MPSINEFGPNRRIEKESPAKDFFKGLRDFFTSQDKFTKLFLITTLLLATSSPYLVTKFFTKAAAPLQTNIEQSVLKYHGYIVEFKDDSVADYKKKTQGEGKTASQPLIDYEKNTLLPKHNEAKNDTLTRLTDLRKGKRQLKPTTILKDYTKVFNGVALDIDDSEADELKKSPFVKNVYPDMEVKSQLSQSVPLINADKVWELKDIAGRNITGKGVKIAILDTGVDYTHPDLGQTNITERSFDRITPSALMLTAGELENDEMMSIDNGRLAYFSGSKIFIYSFSSKTTDEIDTVPTNLLVRRISLKNNLLAYYVYDQSLNGSIYYYDLQTKTNNKIADTQIIGFIQIDNNKIIYSRTPNSTDLFSHIFVYDISTQTEKDITPDNAASNFLQQTSGGRIIYPVTTGYCYDKAIVYDTNTMTSKDIFPPNIGALLDFKGSQILYASCPNWSDYHLYNIDTGEDIKLSFNGVSNSSSATGIQNIIYTFSWLNKGIIGDGVIYFSQDIDTNKIIAYDLNQKRYVQINLLMVSESIAGEGKKICFTSNDSNIYCHDYDPNNPYPARTNFFNSKVIDGYNFVNNSSDPFDDAGHGTHVSAIAAGLPSSIATGTSSPLGGGGGGTPPPTFTPTPAITGPFIGVAKEAQIVSYKVLNSYGSGSFSNVMAAIDRAVSTRLDTDPSNDIDVISMSLGAQCLNNQYSTSCGPDDVVSKSVDNAVDNGITVVIAAGNSGPGIGTITSPGTARKAITVGAVDKSKHIADFSSRGPVIYNGETINKPDVVAPGVNICAAEWSSWYSNYRCGDDKHIAISGTSMATPHVAGIAALIKQAHPDWTPLQIKETIKTTAENLGLTINDQGSGFVNALASLTIPAPSICTPRPACLDLPNPCLMPEPTDGWCPAVTSTPTPSPTPIVPIIPPIRFWRMDDNVAGSGKVILDSSEYSNYGVTYGSGIACNVAGKYNTGCSFGGKDDYISVAYGGSLNGVNQGTMTMWVKWNGIQDTDVCGQYGDILGRQANGLFSNNVISLSTNDPSTARIVWNPYSACSSAIKGTTVAGDGVWHHIAVTFSSGDHKLYVDGNLDGSSTTTGVMNNNSAYTPLTFGAWIGDGGGYSTSTIDEVKIYNYILTQNQVKQDMNPVPTNSPTPTPPLSVTLTPTPPSPFTPTPISGPYKRVFITSNAYSGNLGGLDGADTKCQASADNAKLGGTWKAWLSDSTTSAASRLTHNTGPYKTLISGDIYIANNWDSLIDGSPLDVGVGIAADEFWNLKWYSYNVWSNTDIKGDINTRPVIPGTGNCSNWTSSSNSDSGRTGYATGESPGWSDAPSLYHQPCNASMRLYCFEQNTPSSTPTPTPPQLPCTLASASWSSNTAMKDDTVYLNVASGTNCANKQIALKVSLNGILGGDASIQPASIILDSNGTGRGSWTAEFSPLLPGTNPQYYFTATSGNSTVDTKGSLLTVVMPVTPTPIPTPTPTPTACNLTGASWSTQTTVSDSTVGLSATGNNYCIGRSVTFEVWQNGLGGGKMTDPVPATATFISGNNVASNWIAQYTPVIPFTDPQYYFKAILSGGNTVDTTQALLTVKSVPTPTPIPTPTPTPKITLTPTPTLGPSTITTQILTSKDDVNEDGTIFDTSSSALWIGNGASYDKSYTGLRFNTVSIPKGVTIVSTRLEVYSNQDQWINLGVSFAAQAIGNSPAFSLTAKPSQRPLTTTKVSFSNNASWLKNTWYGFDGLGPIIQEVVRRTDWQTGNSISLIVKGTSRSRARKFVTSFDGSANTSSILSPRLIITFR